MVMSYIEHKIMSDKQTMECKREMNECRGWLTKLVTENNYITPAIEYVNEYIEKNRNNADLFKILIHAVDSLTEDSFLEKKTADKRQTIVYGSHLRQYIISSLCLIGNTDAIHELASFYKVSDADADADADEMNITNTRHLDVTVSMMLCNLENTYHGCLEIIYMCTIGNIEHKYFYAGYPEKRLHEIIKTNLIKAIKLYNKPMNSPEFKKDIGYIFEYIPISILQEISVENNDLAQELLHMK